MKKNLLIFQNQYPKRHYDFIKRLSVYLFIVLVLGLTINLNTDAGIIPYEPKVNQIILINSNTNQILYEKNSNQKINSGGFTKIMTSIIVFDAIKNGKISLNEKLPVSKKAWKISTSGYSAMFVMNGDSISVENLLRGLIIASGNDAAIVLAEGLAGTENNFVKLMNHKAKEIGLNYTKFGNSTGIIIPTNITTVKDVAIMSSYLINNYPELYYFFGEKKFTWNRTGGDPITQGNRNPLLYKNINVDGLRTSYNPTDRYGLASSMYLKNNDDRLIVVGSGFKDKNDRSKESAKLLTFGKINYHTFKIAKKEPLDIEDFQSKPKKTKTKKVKKIQIKTQKLAKYNQSELELIKRFKNYEKNCEPVESKISANKVICIKVTDVLDLGKFREIQSFPEGMLKKKLNWTMLSKKAGQEVYSLFVKRGPQYHARYPGAMILGMSWYEIFYLNQLKKNKKVIERFVTFGPDNYNKYNNPKDPINSIKAKNFPKILFQEDVIKISKLINNNKSKIKMREALGFSNEDKIEDVIKGQWILGTFLNNDKLKAKKVILDPELKKRKILIARYKTALTKYKKKLEEKSN